MHLKTMYLDMHTLISILIIQIRLKNVYSNLHHMYASRDYASQCLPIIHLKIMQLEIHTRYIDVSCEYAPWDTYYLCISRLYILRYIMNMHLESIYLKMNTAYESKAYASTRDGYHLYNSRLCILIYILLVHLQIMHLEVYTTYADASWDYASQNAYYLCRFTLQLCILICILFKHL